MLLGLLLILGAYGLFELKRDFAAIERDEDMQLRTQVRVIEKNLDLQLRSTDAALKELIAGLKHWKVANGYSPEATRRLKALSNASPGVRTFTIVDKNGIIKAANRPELVGIDAKERPYFKPAKEHPDPGMMYLTPPFKSVLGVYIMGVSRIIPGPNGEFDGIVNASLDPAYFQTILESVNYAPDMWTSLAHSDGTLFMITPDHPGVQGKNLARPGSFFSKHMESGQDENLSVGTVYATGEKRIAATHSIRPKDIKTDNFLIVMASRDYDALYEDWRADLAVQAGIFMLLCVSSTLALFIHQSKTRRYERHRAEAQLALQESLDEFNDLVTRIPVGVYKYRMLKDGGSRFEYVSPLWCKLLDIEKEKILADAGKAFSKVHPDELDAFVAANETARMTKSPFEWDGRFHDDNGEYRWLRIESVPFEQENGDLLWNGIMYDVTERKTLLDRLQSSNAELEQFAYVTSHDLREPLRMVSGFISLLEKRYADKLDQDAREFIGFAVDGVKRMDRMILDLLEYSRIGRGEIVKKPVDLSDAVKEALLNLSAAIESTEGQVRIEEPLPVVSGDQGRLVRLFQNLIGNGLKYHVEGKAPHVLVFARRERKRWIVSVKDNGIGIAPEHQNRIFGVFQRLHSQQQYEGSGIGLAICKKIADQHDGEIRVESAPGEGSIFHVILPAD
jgi:PAS domain S-box-containing protein